MIKPSFDIVSTEWDKDELLNCILLMEISEKLFAYVLFNRTENIFIAIRQYNLEYNAEKSSIETLKEIISEDDLLQHKVKEAVLVYNFPFSNLLPAKHFNTSISKPLSQLVFGDTHKGLVFSEKIPGKEMYNVYRIPYDIHVLVQQKFGGGKYWHFYTLFLNSANEPDYKLPNLMNIVFYSDKFIVMVCKDQQLLLIQTYHYQTAEDVAFYLLSMCREFEMSQEEVLLVISGLIDEQSTLYMELLKYFNHVQWDKLPESVNPNLLQQQFPVHYFLPLLKMALCV